MIFRSSKHLYHSVCKSSHDFRRSSSAVHGRPTVSQYQTKTHRDFQGYVVMSLTSWHGRIHTGHAQSGLLDLLVSFQLVPAMFRDALSRDLEALEQALGGSSDTGHFWER